MSKALIIPFFIQHLGCPFTCVFCNQWKITGDPGGESPDSLSHKVREYLEAAKGKARRVEVAFYGGSFTGLPLTEQRSWLEAAFLEKQRGRVEGIRLSTRPDFIDRDIVEMLISYGVTTVELGVQSLVDEVLAQSFRGYSAAEVMRATELIRQYPLELIYQLMLGLPGDTPERAGVTAHRTVAIHPNGVRIYPALVLKETELARWYLEGKYTPWTLSQAVETTAQWLGIFGLYGIEVIRIGLQATENLSPERDLVAGPYHPAFGELAQGALWRRHLEALLSQIGVYHGAVGVMFHPQDHSKVVGQKKSNLRILTERFKFTDLCLKPCPGLSPGDLLVETESRSLFMSREDFLEKYRIK